MSNVSQWLNDLILTKQQITELKVPLQELCMVEYDGASHGPLWISDVSQMPPEQRTEIPHMRWRKFGTEAWMPMEELLGVTTEMVASAELEETESDEKTASFTLETEQEQDQDEFILNQSHVLPPPPSREQLAWGREHVMRSVQQSVTGQDQQHSAVASLVGLLHRGTAPESSKQQAKENEQGNPGEEQKNEPAPVARSTMMKFAVASVACIMVLVGLRLGIARLPNSLVSFIPENQNEEKPSSEEQPVNGDLSIPKRNGRAPASDRRSGRSSRKRNENGSTSRPSSFRDSNAYQQRDMGPDGMPFNDVDRRVEADFPMDDGTAPVEQDPLRRKLSRDTLNPPPPPHELSPDNRAPASEDVPEPGPADMPEPMPEPEPESDNQ